MTGDHTFLVWAAVWVLWMSYWAFDAGWKSMRKPYYGWDASDTTFQIIIIGIIGGVFWPIIIPFVGMFHFGRYWAKP